MRKFMNIFAAALIMLAAVSCEKNEVLPDNNSEGKIVTLKASINNGGTKTSLGGEKGSDDKYPVLWSADDAIAVINNGKLFKFVLDAEDAGTTQGTFTCAEGDGFDETMSVQAFYPYEGVTYYAGAISYTVPATQAYATTVVNEVVCSTFGNGASPMAAYADNAADGLSFENLFGVLKLQLKGAENEKVFGVEIISDNSLKGNAQLTIGDASNSISLTGTESSDKKVILKCEEGVSLSPDTKTDFLVALPANATNLKVLIHTNVGSYIKDIPVSNTNKIVAGQILLMPVLTLGEEDEDVNPIIYMENGVQLGNGIAIPNSDGTFTIWAPVNCGYDAVNFKYGKLYQWGRKYGQGYTTATYGETEPEVVAGPVALEDGQNSDNANKFYKNTSSPYDWVSSPSDALWNSGSVDAPVKTDYDPCPAGWRVPTSDEMKSLSSRFSTSNNNPGASEKNKENFDSEKGYYFYGVVTDEASAVNKVFFPAAGELLIDGTCGWIDYDDDVIPNRGYIGYYWTSTTNGTCSHSLMFGKIYDPYDEYEGGDWYYQLRIIDFTRRASGLSVRCVKDMTQSQPMPGSN